MGLKTKKHRDALDIALPFLRVMVSLALMIAATGSGYWTFLGVLNEMVAVNAPEFAQVAAAVIVAVIITVLLSVGWWLLNSIIPRARTERLKLAGVALALLYAFWAVSVSTLFNAVGLYGGAAMLSDVEARTASLREVAHARVRQAGLLERYLLLVGGQRASLCALASQEAERGILTHAPGKGSVSASLSSLCSQLTVAEERLGVTHAQLTARGAEVQESIRALRADLSDTSLDIHERRRRFLGIAAEIEAWALETRSDEIIDTIDAIFAVLKSSVISVGNADSAFGAKQAENLLSLRTSLEEVAASIEELGVKIRTQSDFEAPSLELLSPSEAAIRYAPKYFAQASAAVGIDLWPIFAICAFAIADAGRRKARSGAKSST